MLASDVEMHDMVSFPAGSQGRGEEGGVVTVVVGRSLVLFSLHSGSRAARKFSRVAGEGRPERGIFACSQLREDAGTGFLV